MTYQDAVCQAFIQLRAVREVNRLTVDQCEKAAHIIALELKAAGYLDRVSNIFKEMDIHNVPAWRERNGIRGIVPADQWESI